MSKTWGFFLVAQDLVQSRCAKFQLIINFFRICMYFVFLPDYNCSCTHLLLRPKNATKTEQIGFVSSFLSLVAFRLGKGGCRKPGPPGYACGLMITVQVCSHIYYKICHNQTAKEHLPL